MGDEEDLKLMGMTQVKTLTANVVTVRVDGVPYSRKVVKVHSLIDFRYLSPGVAYKLLEFERRTFSHSFVLLCQSAERIDGLLERCIFCMNGTLCVVDVQVLKSQYEVCILVFSFFHSMSSREFDVVEFQAGGDAFVVGDVRFEVTKHCLENRILGNSMHQLKF